MDSRDAANASRRAKMEAVWARRKATGYVAPATIRKVVARSEVWVPRAVLLGRALIALAVTPLSFEALAELLGVDEDELAERAHELAPHVCAIRVGDTWLAHHRGESWERLNPIRESLLTGEQRKEQRRAA